MVQKMKTYQMMIIILAGLLSASCEKYLDVKANSTQVFLKTSEDCQKLLDDYGVMNTIYPSDAEASAGDTYLTDASYNSASAGLTAEDRTIYTWQEQAIRSVGQWRNIYFKIYEVNTVLDLLDNLSDKPDQTTINRLRGAALFYRAFAFWQIAQSYAPPYTAADADQQPGIPIRLESDINEVLVRGTVSQTYARIVQDLKEAVDLLPVSVSVSSRPSKVAALAMLARVYLSMEDYSQAQSSANAALQIKSDLLDYRTISTTSLTPFTRFHAEVIFQATMTRTPLLAPGVASSSSSVLKIVPELVAQYEVGDLRRSIFLKQVDLMPNVYTFSGNYEQAFNGAYFVGLAVDELYLIRAECYARGGDASLAMADLNKLLRMRWSGTYTDKTAGTADQALTLVLTERRKELLLRGLRWSDLRRLNRDPRFAVTLKRTVLGVEYTLPPNALRYTLLIPSEVINLSAHMQNKR
jgi:tetratricopeptide (TPR) repeat protein